MALGTVSNLYTPEPYGSVNTNGLWIILNSPSYLEQDFKYVVNMYKVDIATGATNTSLGSYKVPPNPYDGNGYFSPHRILKSHLKNKVMFGVATFSTAPYYNTVWTSDNAQIQYHYNYGFEKKVNLYFSAMSSGAANQVVITFPTPHELLENDIITIVKNSPNQDGYINGLATIVSVTTYTITANYANTPTIYGPSLPINTDTGHIVYLSRYTGNATYSNRANDNLYGLDSVLPATYSYENTSLYNKALNDYENNILTEWKDARYIFRNENESVSYLDNKGESSNRIENVKYTMYSYEYPNDSLISATITLTTASASSSLRNRHYQVATGTNEVATILGLDFSGGLDDSNWYKVELLGATALGSPVRGTITRIINKETQCYNKRICWLNERAGWDFYTFTFDTTYKTTIRRNDINTQLPFDYNLMYNNGNRQRQILSIEEETIYTVQSDWLSETDYKKLVKIMTSPEVYIVDGVAFNKSASLTMPQPRVTPINIVGNTYESKTVEADDLFNFKLEYQLAYDPVLHNR